MEIIDNKIEKKIISIRDELVILDSEVAQLYGVETRDINKAVKNNPDKFPKGYIIELTKEEKSEVVENFHHLEKLKFSPYLPKVFTEKGLYMLATILKSDIATQTTIQIIETFTKLREFGTKYSDIVTQVKELEKTIKIDQQQINYNTHKIDEAFELLNEILKDTEKTDKNLIGFKRKSDE